MPHAHGVVIVLSEGFQDNFCVKARSATKYHEEVVENSDSLEGPRPAQRYVPRLWRTFAKCS